MYRTPLAASEESADLRFLAWAPARHCLVTTSLALSKAKTSQTNAARIYVMHYVDDLSPHEGYYMHYILPTTSYH